MIRVNVLKTKVSDASDLNYGQGISMDVAESGGTADQKELMVKILLILFPLIVLYGYEYMNISDLEDQSASINAELQRQQTEINALKQKAGKATEYEGEAKKLDEKLGILMSLSKKRLRELKALDYLQNILPDGVWLSNIKYDGSNISFTGGAINDNDLGSFVTSLETSNYFQNVLVSRAVERKSGKRSYKDFEINTVLGELE